MAERKLVVVRLQDGSVVGVDTPPGVDVHIIDLDTEGADVEDLCDCYMALRPHFHAEYPGERAEEWIMRRMKDKED